MQIGSDIRESAFHSHDDRDHVIKIEIRGNTVNEIDQVASEAGLTSAQWIRSAIAMMLIESTKSALCQDPDCAMAWAEHDRHN